MLLLADRMYRTRSKTQQPTQTQNIFKKKKKGHIRTEFLSDPRAVSSWPSQKYLGFKTIENK